jgi:hypothetical protein
MARKLLQEFFALFVPTTQKESAWPSALRFDFVVGKDDGIPGEWQEGWIWNARMLQFVDEEFTPNKVQICLSRRRESFRSMTIVGWKRIVGIIAGNANPLPSKRVESVRHYMLTFEDEQHHRPGLQDGGLEGPIERSRKGCANEVAM